MNGNNEHIDVLIFRFLDKVATEQESAELLDWVNSQAQNKLYFQQISKQFVALSGSSPHFDADVAWDKNNVLVNKNPAFGLSAMKIITIALLLGALLAGVAWWCFHSDTDEQTELTAPIVDVYTAGDSIKEIILTDGVKLTLDAHTEIAVTKYKDLNLIKVNGRVLVQVPEAIHNYEVVTLGGKCKLNEGVFQLQQDNSLKTTQVKVVEGDAILNSENSQVQTTLTKNDAVSIREGQAVVRDTLRNANYLAWKTGVLEFDNTPLREAIPQIAEYYKTEIVIATPGLEECLLNAKLDRYTFDEVKMMFEIAFQAQFKLDSSKVFISGAACK